MLLVVLKVIIVRSNFNTREFNSRVFVVYITFTRDAFPVLDHLWTQGSPIIPHTC